MSKLTAAYLAGFIDGEGSFGMRKNKNRHNYLVSRVRITNTDKDIMEWIHKSFGGSLYKTKFNNDKWKEAYTWTLEGNRIIPFIQKVKPYLRMKAPQAELLLRREKLKEYTLNHGARLGMSYTKKVQEELENIFLELKRLNTRGKSLHAERLSEVNHNSDMR